MRAWRSPCARALCEDETSSTTAGQTWFRGPHVVLQTAVFLGHCCIGCRLHWLCASRIAELQVRLCSCNRYLEFGVLSHPLLPCTFSRHLMANLLSCICAIQMIVTASHCTRKQIWRAGKFCQGATMHAACTQRQQQLPSAWSTQSQKHQFLEAHQQNRLRGS